MKISDLPRKITCTKADWLPGTSWIGFTPTGTGANAFAQCQATINRQIAGGLVLERMTQSFGAPTAGFENDPIVVQDRARHRALADRIIAVHELRPSARPLRDIIGANDFNHLQDVWSASGSRDRWSVAFPIVRTWEVLAKPKAHDILSEEVFRSTYRTQNALLRPVGATMAKQIADLEIEERVAPNAWIAIEDEIEIAARDNSVPNSIARGIAIDLAGALEGEEEERKTKVKRRAAWLAYKFWLLRQKLKALNCDDCGFDPSADASLAGLPRRSLFDVHHKNPLAEGVRRTTTDDFALLCPRCHRIEHVRLRTFSVRGLGRPLGSEKPLLSHTVC
jgi:5-methylcytosine-specific restriction protein A